MGDDEGEFDRYNAIVAAVLAKLLRNGGLRRTDLSWVEFPEVRPALVSSNDFEEMFSDTIFWLRDEGYIRVGDSYGGTENESRFPDCVLTAACLVALNQKIEALDGASGRDILLSNSGGTPAGSYTKAGSLLGGILGGFTKSISG